MFYISYAITLTFGAGMSGGVDIAPKKASWSTGWMSKKKKKKSKQSHLYINQLYVRKTSCDFVFYLSSFYSLIHS